MESFIRSKYESRRWAMEGPPPADPSVLDGGASASAPAPAAEPASPPQRTQQQQPIAPPSGGNTPTPQAQGSRKPQRTLLSSNAFTAPTPAPAVVSTQPPAAPPASSVQNDIFSLDFTPPAANTPSHSHSGSLSGGAGAAKNNTKNDIMSLFSSAPPPGAQSILGGGQPAQAVPTNTAPTSFMGTNGTGLWGVQSGWQAPAAAAPSSDPWGSFASAASPVQQQQQPQQPAQQAFFGAAPMAPAQPPMNVWGAPPAQAQPNAFNAGNVWGAQPAAAPANAGGANAFDLFTSGGAASNATAGAGAAKKDDAFDNLWG
ncbi:hypothetical protein DL93DRAFT_2086691 [Clavulina sp. PMI_390]|nr:hypothetical protein DL93DRAFT_2086691 [Clavulina sp. PMI_390]